MEEASIVKNERRQNRPRNYECFIAPATIIHFNKNRKKYIFSKKPGLRSFKLPYKVLSF